MDLFRMQEEAHNGHAKQKTQPFIELAVFSDLLRALTRHDLNNTKSEDLNTQKYSQIP